MNQKTLRAKCQNMLQKWRVLVTVYIYYSVTGGGLATEVNPGLYVPAVLWVEGKLTNPFLHFLPIFCHI